MPGARHYGTPEAAALGRPVPVDCGRETIAADDGQQADQPRAARTDSLRRASLF